VLKEVPKFQIKKAYFEESSSSAYSKDYLVPDRAISPDGNVILGRGKFERIPA